VALCRLTDLVARCDAPWGIQCSRRARIPENTRAQLRGDIHSWPIYFAARPAAKHTAGSDGIEANAVTGDHAIEFLLWRQHPKRHGEGAGTRPWTDCARGDDRALVTGPFLPGMASEAGFAHDRMLTPATPAIFVRNAALFRTTRTKRAKTRPILMKFSCHPQLIEVIPNKLLYRTSFCPHHI
jgi:hypothetical protein